MSSLRRKRSSRANGRLSRGPVTPEGKQRSSQNAISHGLLAKCIVLPGEDPESFQATLDQHLDRFAPLDAVEESMIEEMVAANWRMRRAWSMETKLLTDGIATQTGPDNRSRITGAFQNLADSPALALLQRYETRLHMMYQRAFHNLLLLRDIVPPPDAPANTDVLPAVTPQPSGIAPINPMPTSPTPVPDLPVPLRPAAQASATPAIPNEPNPISEHRSEACNRRRLQLRKQAAASRRALLPASGRRNVTNSAQTEIRSVANS
jgi:hypothetical protein